jgi:hypothetical protein
MLASVLVRVGADASSAQPSEAGLNYGGLCSRRKKQRAGRNAIFLSTTRAAYSRQSVIINKNNTGRYTIVA